MFREIGEIDETYVEEARRAGRRRSSAPWMRAMAAAASLLVCVGIGYGTLWLPHSSNDMTSMAGGGDMEDMEIYSTAQDSDAAMNGQAVQEAGEDVPWEEEKFQETARVPEAVPEEETAYDEGAAETGIAEMEMDRQSQEGDGAAVSSKDGEVTKDVQQETLIDTSSPMIGLETLTWQQAREDDTYGKYVDIQVPEGYVYESGVRSESALRVVWLNGPAEISVSCRRADEAVSDWLVDVDESREYDLSLYAMPWADSVPQELREKVFNATFQSGQLTPEIVAARSYQAEDSGDVSGWRTDIGILYGDNVLVEITSKGPTPEEIYEMINLENY